MDDEKPPSVIAEAMDWLLRLETSPGDPAARRGLEQWLAQSPENRVAFDRACRTWELIGAVPPVHAKTWRGLAASSGKAAPPNPNRARRRFWPQSRTGRGLAVAVAMAACLALVAAFPSFRIGWEADYTTGTAGSRIVHLADGSRVILGADSAIQAEVSDAGRLVRLLAGEAFFDVVRDEGRPFRVEAGEVEVTVLGTRFDVRLSSAATSVELAHGAVAVATGALAAPQTLAAGESIVVDHATGNMQRGTIAPEDVGAWRDNRLFVDGATIGSVVEVIRRYHPGWVGLADADLAAERVTGLYDLRNPDRALRALVEPYGGTVWSFSPYGRLISR